MKVLVCGGRTYSNWTKVEQVLDDLHNAEGIYKDRPWKITCIIQGGAPGADLLGKKWAMKNGICCIQVDANWSYYKKAAGPIRNRWMLDFCNPDMCVAFPEEGSKGTYDMLDAAFEAGVTCSHYKAPGGEEARRNATHWMIQL